MSGEELVIEWSVKAADIAIVIATLIGPVLAVQAQKWLERNREVKQRRANLFRMLMATRATTLSPAHVEALNAVPIEFYGSSVALRSIVEKWKIYLDHLGKDISAAGWQDTRQQLFVDLLHSMASHLGYDINEEEIKNEFYSPRGHAVIESDQEIIRRGLALLLSGKLPLPMEVKQFPFDQTVAKEQEELRHLLLEWLKGQNSVSVNVKSETGK